MLLSNTVGSTGSLWRKEWRKVPECNTNLVRLPTDQPTDTNKQNGGRRSETSWIFATFSLLFGCFRSSTLGKGKNYRSVENIVYRLIWLDCFNMATTNSYFACGSKLKLWKFVWLSYKLYYNFEEKLNQRNSQLHDAKRPFFEDIM